MAPTSRWELLKPMNSPRGAAVVWFAVARAVTNTCVAPPWRRSNTVWCGRGRYEVRVQRDAKIAKDVRPRLGGEGGSKRMGSFGSQAGPALRGSWLDASMFLGMAFGCLCKCLEISTVQRKHQLQSAARARVRDGCLCAPSWTCDLLKASCESDQPRFVVAEMENLPLSTTSDCRYHDDIDDIDVCAQAFGCF